MGKKASKTKFFRKKLKFQFSSLFCLPLSFSYPKFIFLLFFCSLLLPRCVPPVSTAINCGRGTNGGGRVLPPSFLSPPPPLDNGDSLLGQFVSSPLFSYTFSAVSHPPILLRLVVGSCKKREDACTTFCCTKKVESSLISAISHEFHRCPLVLFSYSAYDYTSECPPAGKTCYSFPPFSLASCSR